MNGSFSTYIHPKLYFEFGLVQLKLIEENFVLKEISFLVVEGEIRLIHMKSL